MTRQLTLFLAPCNGLRNPSGVGIVGDDNPAGLVAFGFDSATLIMYL